MLRKKNNRSDDYPYPPPQLNLLNWLIPAIYIIVGTLASDTLNKAARRTEK